MSKIFFRTAIARLSLAAQAFLMPVIFSGCSHAPSTTVSEKTSKFFGETPVHRYLLSNGLKVLILEDHSAPTIAYQTWFNVGSRDEEKGRTGLAHLFEHMMFKETKRFKDGQFDRLLESAGAEGENAFTSHDYTGYVQALPSDKLDLIAKLESDRMVNLLVNDAALAKEREVVQNERRFRKENSPDGQLHQRLYELAYTEHSYHWPVIGYDADLQGASRHDCENFYKRYYAPNNATIVIVGDVEPSSVMATIGKYYSDIKPSKIDRHISPTEPRQTRERSEAIAIKTPIEKLMLGYHAVPVNHMDFPVLEVLRSVLAGGKGSRLYKRLVDSGIASNVEVENADMSQPGLFIIFVNMQKNKTAKQALALIDQELQAARKGRITQEEIDRAVAMNHFSFFDGLVSNMAKAQFMGYYETVAGDYGRGIELMNAMKTVDRRSIARVSQAYLQKSNRTVILGAP